ncbi:MAG: hypothetical protein HY928_04930 [Elusimicrobia bacterium]|nr:hypothetical protein [Elusimicrobiota bacterium]
MTPALALVWTGSAVQLLSLFVSPYLMAVGVALACAGLVLFHRAKGHSTRYVVIGGLAGLWPLIGPVLGLMLKPPPDGPASDGISYRTWTVVQVVLALLGAMAPMLGGDLLAKGCSSAAAFSLAAYAASRFGLHRLAVGLFVMNFVACAAVIKTGTWNSPLVRGSYEGTTKARLVALRQRADDGGPEREAARLPPYHKDSNAVLNAAAPDDSGGWRYDASARQGQFRFFVNCTHTDSKGTSWTEY